MVVNDMKKKDIVIEQVLMHGGASAFVAFYSHADSKTHLIDANRFMEIFGFSVEDLKKLQAKKEK